MLKTNSRQLYAVGVNYGLRDSFKGKATRFAAVLVSPSSSRAFQSNCTDNYDHPAELKSIFAVREVCCLPGHNAIFGVISEWPVIRPEPSTCIGLCSKSRIPATNLLDERIGDYALINAPEPIITMCKDGFIASIPSLYVFLIDKGDKAGAHPYNRVLARA